MQTLFKLAYGLAVAILFVLFVILGTRTFYDEPAEDFGEMGTAPLFGVVAAGLAVILAAGCRFLGLVRPGEGG